MHQLFFCRNLFLVVWWGVVVNEDDDANGEDEHDVTCVRLPVFLRLDWSTSVLRVRSSSSSRE
jgi:hypothetical protein